MVKFLDRNRKWFRQNRARFVFPGIFVVVVLLTPILRFGLGKMEFIEVVRLNGALTAMEQKQLDIHLESTRLLISLATLLLGGLGFFIAAEKGDRNNLVRRERPLVYATMGFASAAIALGQVSYEMLAWMLSTQIFNPQMPLLMWPRTLQYWSFVLSVGFFSVFVVKALRGGPT